MGLKLSDLIVKNKEAKNIDYDKDWKVGFKICFLSKPELQSLIGRFTKIEFNPKTHLKEENVDSEKLTDEIINKCVAGWYGVTYKWLGTQTPLDFTKIEKPEEELEFNKDNLNTLIKESYGIDSWIIDTVKNAANFNEKKEDEIKNLPSLPNGL